MRQALSVIARRCRQDTASADSWVERQQLGQRPSQLERTGVLEILQLQIQLTAGERGERLGPLQRRPPNEWRDGLRGVGDVRHGESSGRSDHLFPQSAIIALASGAICPGSGLLICAEGRT